MKIEEFLSSYGNVIARYWNDSDFRALAERDPKAAIEEEGLSTGDAKVTLITKEEDVNLGLLSEFGIDPSEHNNEEIAFELFKRGVQSNDVRILIPGPVETDQELGELTDEELMSVAGGEDDSWVNINVSWGGGDWVNVGWG